MNEATKKFHRTAISRRDFRETQEFLKCLKDEKKISVRYALLTAAIVSYARPFSGNEKEKRPNSTGKLHLDPAQILDSIQLALHHEIIHLRNKLVAHAEYAASPVRLLNKTGSGMELLGPYVEKDGTMYDLRNYLERIDPAVFARVAELFSCHCGNELFRLKDEEGSNNTVEVSVDPRRAR